MFAALNSFLTRAVSGYFLNKSLRFRASASAYLNRTPTTTGSRTTFTWSGWVKRGALGTGIGNRRAIFSSGRTDASPQNGLVFRFFDDQINASSGGGVSLSLTSSAVYRDPAAWYHLVFAVDTTQGTASNRVKIYVNGAQVTSFGTATYPSASQNFDINTSSYTAYNGVENDTATLVYYFDGEMAEVNFVDGQALAPTAFGAYSTYNQWLPIKYAGTYGTNGFYLPFNATSATSYAGYFDGTTNWLSTPQSSNFTFDANFTIEFWVYITANQNAEFVATANNSAYLGSGNSGWIVAYYTASGIRFSYQSSNSWVFETILSITPSLNSWNHVAIVRNGSAITGYLNGVAGSSPGTSSATLTSNLYGAYIGSGAGNQSFKLGGYISNVRIVKGTAVYTANFVPPTAALTAISGTQLLTLQNATIVDNSTNAFTITNTGTVVTSVQSPFLNPRVLVADSSGNANNWTPNNISLTAGSTYDSLTDVPTLTSTTVANYAVLNPLVPPELSTTFNDGNLRFVGAGAVVGSMGMSAKTYVEMTPASATDVAIGVGPLVSGSRGGAGSGIQDSVLWFSGGSVFKDGGATAVATYATFTTNDVCAFTFDPSNRQVTFYKNNVSQGSQTVSGTQAISFYTLGNVGATAAVNFGQQPFTYTPPSGFLPLNTFNI